ncbi:hypothetical protein [Lysinibacillus fusiformis]|uniref:hypothetical protein n=1 Tax=Lysinibacillus fusiformis TaxID=28031 RepID=UPI003711C4D4
MYNLTTVSKATKNKKEKIIKHVKYIRKRYPNFGVYNGVHLMLTSDELGQYSVFALDVERLGSMKKALENLVLSRTNTIDLLKIINSASADLADLATNEQKYFDFPLGLK